MFWSRIFRNMPDAGPWQKHGISFVKIKVLQFTAVCRLGPFFIFFFCCCWFLLLHTCKKATQVYKDHSLGFCQVCGAEIPQRDDNAMHQSLSATPNKWKSHFIQTVMWEVGGMAWCGVAWRDGQIDPPPHQTPLAPPRSQAEGGKQRRKL